MAKVRRALSLDGACQFAGISRRTIYYWIAKGKVSFYRNTKGQLRIDLDSLVLGGVETLDSSEKFLTIVKAMSISGRCRRTIYNWIDAGRVKVFRVAGGSQRISARSLLLCEEIMAQTIQGKNARERQSIMRGA